MTHECLDCDRTFASLPAVQSHARVKGHSLPECKDCDRAFVSKDAMTNHLKHSSLHGYCEDCDRFFSTQSSYEQHVADALRHQDPYCKDCDRHFSTEDGYEQQIPNIIKTLLPKSPRKIPKALQKSRTKTLMRDPVIAVTDPSSMFLP
ncbi:hypothetical protein AGABI1DRAFT_129707 [Agaricus bisporus var. burnettii JB137-S8]|uniref:C2H2-type domain-containing protein n=1 Tax=Agaricus bisporus var. burnettii (strain JB137-S8 / ATCC MYA-4627 / FGSC 10392) TaxID=597362 RepID=K5X4P3_AGABU|nr:uncharacterized protein AGABI1DRAFT_129707 [Agaricus bisporus var. burnettii JB137-S8]EKM77917.1 hypothetical protein AGABI1DRAFT_129707 [Agaricus bisporus var. burnettii JB137-S8]